MRLEHVPVFIDELMEKVEMGIDMVAQRKAAGGTMIVKYPDMVEIQLDVEWYFTVLEPTGLEGKTEVSRQQCWVKIPWPKPFGPSPDQSTEPFVG